MKSWRVLLVPALLAAAWLAGCAPRPARQDDSEKPRPRQASSGRVESIDRSLASAARFFLDRQGPDGAWRSANDAHLTDGGSLTPLVLQALISCPTSPKLEPAYRKGAAYLAGMVRRDGTINEGEHGLNYPVYTAAGAVIVLGKPCNARHRKARDAWLTYLRKRQLTEDLGWKREGKEFGGWGYSIGLPTKPKEERLTESNLSATAFALDALVAAGVDRKDAAFERALTFVQRCQNYSADAAARNPAFDDGGFFFIYDDANRNKAGLAGQEADGRKRFVSYGSTTADGLRSLIACGLSADHPRVKAARRWLEQHFDASFHPGTFNEDREGTRREGVYYYYVRSAALSLRITAGPKIQTLKGKVAWAEELADELMKRQEKDGSWINPADFYQEDDPILSTSMAVSALAVCRQVITGKSNEAITKP